MLTSMTGFGRSGVVLPSAGRATVEIQTLNHRFLDVECRLPEGFMGLEQSIRAQVARGVHRGRVRVYLNVKMRRLTPASIVRREIAQRYTRELRQLKKQLKLDGDVTLEAVIGLPHVVEAPAPDESLQRWTVPIGRAVSEAVGSLVKMRRKEGVRLERTLQGIHRSLRDLYQKVSRQVPKVQKGLSRRLQAKLRAEVPSADPAACVREAALLIRETDVAEELARIGSHLSALRQAVEGAVDSPGRTMDFLAQELQREINTLGVKIRDGAVSRQVVEMKGLVEKLREQAANVE